MFSAQYYKEIKDAFDRQMALLDERCHRLRHNMAEGEKSGEGDRMSELSERFLFGKKQEILNTLARCTEEEAQALTFLYSAMPLSDLLDYPAGLFLTYAKHGVFLWNHGAFAGRVPEKLFANYVLHYRVNNEDIADTRGFFYDRVREAVDMEKAASGTMYDTAIDVNYWCAREATYRSTDERTQNPRTMYGVTMGRCGEESTFAVTALRSIGIPARQIYAPLWTHCDDNHAWVELWCDGKWHFLGACEPEEEMDRGWFTGPASRAVMLHTRWFGKDEPEERLVGPAGMAKVLNQMERYACTTELEVRVEDEGGLPVPNAKVDFQALNHGGFGPVAVIYTGSEGENCGIARLMMGLGDLYVSASADITSGSGTDSDNADGEISVKKLYGETMVSPGSYEKHTESHAEETCMESGVKDLTLSDSPAGGKTVKCKIVLKEKPECTEGWRELDIHAPEPGDRYNGMLTDQQENTGGKRLAQAAEYRQKKAESFYNEREAERVLGRFGGEEREQVREILHKAHGNMGEIVRFLEWDAGFGLDGMKLKALNTLREKDYWDIEAEVLTDCCINASAYAENVPEEIFYEYLLCPRVSDEMLRPCRMALKKYWDAYTDDSVKVYLRQHPECLPELVDRWVISMPEQEYENLITSSLGCIRGGVGSRHSKEVLCVNLYRALGIPARLNPLDGNVEYYKCGRTKYADQCVSEPGSCGEGESLCGEFVSCGGAEKSCVLTLCEDGSLKLSDWEHYSLERFEGDGFRRLGTWEQISVTDADETELHVTPGIYRIVTTNRKKNGDQLVRMAVFSLREGESRRMTVSMRKMSSEDMLIHIQVSDFSLTTMEGSSAALSELTEGGKALFLWLGVTREPTEHILNELYDRREEFASLKAPIYAVLKTPEDLEDATLSRTLEALPGIRTLLDDFGGNYHLLAKTVGQEPGKLPLAVVMKGQQECIYSDAGYNVGLADMLYKILV